MERCLNVKQRTSYGKLARCQGNRAQDIAGASEGLLSFFPMKSNIQGKKV
jgi:hypothetical protein